MLLLWRFSTTYSYVVRGIPADLSIFLPDPLTKAAQKTEHGSTGNLSPVGHAYFEYRKGKKTLERKVRGISRNGCLFCAAHAAYGTAENMDVCLFSGTVKHTGYEVAVRGYGFTADRAASAQIVFNIGIAVGAAENVGDSVGFSWKYNRLYLFPGGKARRAERTSSNRRSCSLLLSFTS